MPDDDEAASWDWKFGVESFERADGGVQSRQLTHTRRFSRGGSEVRLESSKQGAGGEPLPFVQEGEQRRRGVQRSRRGSGGVHWSGVDVLGKTVYFERVGGGKRPTAPAPAPAAAPAAAAPAPPAAADETDSKPKQGQQLKLPATVSAVSTRPRQELGRCSMCTHQFPRDSLKGLVSMKKILDLRATWGVTLSAKRYSTASYMYGTAHLCVFCAQMLADADDDATAYGTDDIHELIRASITGQPGGEEGRSGTGDLQQDLALHRPCQQSSAVAAHSAMQAVDGSLRSWAETREEEQPWWQVDLGAAINVASVRVRAPEQSTSGGEERDPGCEAQVPYWILVSERPFPKKPCAMQKLFAQASARARVTLPQYQTEWHAHGAVSGRYVRVQSERRCALRLSRVEVLKASDRQARQQSAAAAAEGLFNPEPRAGLARSATAPPAQAQGVTKNNTTWRRRGSVFQLEKRFAVGEVAIMRNLFRRLDPGGSGTVGWDELWGAFSRADLRSLVEPSVCLRSVVATGVPERLQTYSAAKRHLANIRLTWGNMLTCVFHARAPCSSPGCGCATFSTHVFDDARCMCEHKLGHHAVAQAVQQIVRFYDDIRTAPLAGEGLEARQTRIGTPPRRQRASAAGHRRRAEVRRPRPATDVVKRPKQQQQQDPNSPAALRAAVERRQKQLRRRRRQIALDLRARAAVGASVTPVGKPHALYGAAQTLDATIEHRLEERRRQRNKHLRQPSRLLLRQPQRDTAPLAGSTLKRARFLARMAREREEAEWSTESDTSDSDAESADGSDVHAEDSELMTMSLMSDDGGGAGGAGGGAGGGDSAAATTVEEEERRRRRAAERRRKRRQQLEAEQEPVSYMPRGLCALCQREYPRDALFNSVTRLAVHELKARWDLPSATVTDRLRTTASQYNSKPVCVFCAQLFDRDFDADLRAIEQGRPQSRATGITFAQESVDDPHFDSRFPLTYTTRQPASLQTLRHSESSLQRRLRSLEKVSACPDGHLVCVFGTDRQVCQKCAAAKIQALYRHWAQRRRALRRIRSRRAMRRTRSRPGTTAAALGARSRSSQAMRPGTQGPRPGTVSGFSPLFAPGSPIVGSPGSPGFSRPGTTAAARPGTTASTSPTGRGRRRRSTKPKSLAQTVGDAGQGNQDIAQLAEQELAVLTATV